LSHSLQHWFVISACIVNRSAIEGLLDLQVSPVRLTPGKVPISVSSSNRRVWQPSYRNLRFSGTSLCMLAPPSDGLLPDCQQCGRNPL
jgi:hypothetical protein